MSDNDEEYPVVYVTNIHPSVYTSSSEISTQYLEEIFGKFGKIEQTDIIDTDAGSAVISYIDIRDARDAARELNGLELFGRRILVSMDHRIFEKSAEESVEESVEESEPGYIIVRGIHPDTTGYEISRVLNHAGVIDSVTINKDYAIVRYHNKDSVEYALKYNNKIIHGIKVNIDVPNKKELIDSYHSRHTDDRISKKSNSINVNRIREMLSENKVNEAILELESLDVNEQIHIISQLVSKVQLEHAIKLLMYTYRLIRSEKIRLDEAKMDCVNLLVNEQPIMFRKCTEKFNPYIDVDEDDVNILYRFMDAHFSNPGVMKGALLYLHLHLQRKKPHYQKDEIYTYLKFRYLVYDTVTGRYVIVPTLSHYDGMMSLSDRFINDIHRLIMYQDRLPERIYSETRDIVNRTTMLTKSNFDTEHMNKILSHYYFLYDVSRFHKYYILTFPEVLEKISRRRQHKLFYLHLYYFIYIAIIGRLLDNHSYQDLEMFRTLNDISSFFDELPNTYRHNYIRTEKSTKQTSKDDALFIPEDAMDKLFEIYRKFDTIVRQETN